MKKKFLAVLLVLCAVVLFALPAYAASDTSVGYTVNVTLSADSYFCGTEGHTGEVTSISIKNVNHSKWDTDPTRPLTVLFEVSFKCNTCGVSGTKIANNALSLTFRDADSCHAPFNASVTARKLLTGRDDSITFTLTRDKIGYAEKIDKKDATCTESGISQTCWECQGCKQIFSDENCTNKLANDISGVTIPASGHSLTHYEAQDANCQHDGWVEHWRCGKCNGYFLDATGLNPTGSSSVMRYDRNKHVGNTVYVPYNLEGKRNHKVYPSCHPGIFTTEPHVLGDSSKGEDPDYCALCGQIVAAKVLHSVAPYEKRFFAHVDAIEDFNSSETSEEIHFLRSFDRTVSINKAGTVRLAEGKYITYMNVGDYDVTIWNDGKITNLNAYSSTTLRGSKTGTYGKITNRTEGGTVGDLLFRVNSNSAYYVTEDLQWISRAAASGSSISEVRVLYSPFTYIEITGDGVKAATDEADKYKLTALRGETVILDVATYSIQPAMNFPGSDSSITWDYGGIPDDHVRVDRNVDWKDLRLTITDLPSGTYTLTFTRTAVNKFSVSATLVLTVEETLTAHTVTFDPNGGTLNEDEKSKSVMPGDAYGALPTPTRDSHHFSGWYTSQVGGTKVDETTVVTELEDHTLYAHWTPIHVHAYTQQVQKPEALKTPADCTNNAVYYLSCACGEVSTNDADTFTAANTALDHDWGAWTQNSDEKTHTRICKRDTSHTETENCHGGTATCTAKAVCTVCGGAYGEMAAHSFTTEKAETQYLKSAATCTEKAIYYKSCTVCGLSSAGTADEATFFSGNVLDHDWGAWTQNSDEKTHTRTCKRDESHTETGNCTGGTATCTAKAVCEVCKAEYGEKDPEHHAEGCELEWIVTETEHEQKYSLCGKVTIAKGKHTFGDWTIIKRPTSNRDGEKERICQICQHKEAKTIPATGSNYSYYTIKATAGTGGSISPSGNVSVREGRDQTFTITPDKGYAVANVKIDGKSIGAVKSYTFENVRRTHTIEVIFMKANGNPQTGVFVDVATGSYYEDAVDWAVENGITKGTDDTHFSPDGICTRAQAVTFLWRAAGSPEPETRAMPFNDVPVGSYYYDAVLWAVENGITKGTSETTFSPNMTCSRAQIVAFLWRSEKSPAAGTANPFADVKSTAYYAGAVLWAVREDITKGTTSTTFSPDADCSRAQIVTFLWRCKK